MNNIASDLPPKPGQHPGVGRDYEYKRLGTVSILAALDLHTGKILAQVHDRHRSREFIELLKELDAYYPKTSTIRIVLDNHSAHISKETMKYLESRPSRFIYVHTPKIRFMVKFNRISFLENGSLLFAAYPSFQQGGA